VRIALPNPRPHSIHVYVGFEVLTAVVVNTSVFWDVSEEHVAFIFRVVEYVEQ
jgi:hypothetical protein